MSRLANTVDLSNSAGNVPDEDWTAMKNAGVSYAVVAAFGGGSPSASAEKQLIGDGKKTKGAQGNGLVTGAYLILNYFSQDSAIDQIDEAISAVGAGFNQLKFFVLDVETCCGEFVSWRPSTAYSQKCTGTGKCVIMDQHNHIQRVIVSGTSGATVPAWNDAGGSTSDGSVTWMDSGKVVLTKAQRIERLSSAASYIQQMGKKPLIYTDSDSWQVFTGNCDTGTANNCADLIQLPLWDVEHRSFTGVDGVKHCGDGVSGILPFTPYSALSWQARSANQYDFGVVSPPNPTLQTDQSSEEYDDPENASGSPCSGEQIFGTTLDLDYFDPTLFQ